ncbi:MAG: WG repeat-containing protein [Verrucomicrobia subdivision 3 bacterium]|nr:WG repeat-containing protein [Limisphaerales bacterium]
MAGPIKEASGCGFLDEQGKPAVPPKFEELGQFSEGLASSKRDAQIGFIDANGNEVIAPQFWADGY